MPTLFDPFEQLREFQRAIDAFRSSGWLGSGLSAGGTYPPMNIFGKGDDIIAIIEVPGCASRISTSGSSAIRCASPEARVSSTAKAAMHRRERSAGPTFICGP